MQKQDILMEEQQEYILDRRFYEPFFATKEGKKTEIVQATSLNDKNFRKVKFFETIDLPR